MTDRGVQFSEPEMLRIHDAARALGTTQRELVRVSVLHACDEIAGIAEAVRREQPPDDPRRAELRKLVEVATELRAAQAAWDNEPTPTSDDPEADEWHAYYDLQERWEGAEDAWRALYQEWFAKDSSDEASLQRLLADVVGPLL